MGVLDFLRPHRSLLTAAAVATSAAASPVVPSKEPPTEARGVPGGANFAGRLVFEPNVDLRDTAGYGRAGTYEVGEWQEAAQSNAFVAMALDFIAAPISDARVTVEPADKKSPEAAKQAEFLEWALTQAYRLQNHNETAARGFLLSGFSLFEPTYRQVPCPMLGRPAWVPAQIAERLPNSLDANAWIENERGELKAIRQTGPRGSNGQWIRPLLEAEKVLLYAWKQRANNWAGESQFRAVWYVAGRIMPMLTKMVGVTLQREGAGLPVAVPTSDKSQMTPEQRDELMTFFANATFHESSGVVMPVGYTIEWVMSPGSNKGHIIDAINALGLWILQQLGAQQLSLGTGATGSRSVGEVHDARSMAFVRKCLSFIEGVLNGDGGESHTGLAKRLIDWAFGPQVAYPRVKLVAQRPELGPKEMAEAVKAAKEAGLITPTLKDQNFFRERASLGQLSDKEFEELSGAGTTTALNGAQVTAATDLMTLVAEGQLPVEAAIEALVTFYNVSLERAEKLMATLKTFKPTPKEAPAPFGGPGGEGPGHGAEGEPPTSRVGVMKQPAALAASAQRGAWKPWRPLRASEEKVKFAAIDALFAERKDDFETTGKAITTGMLAGAGPAIERAMADGKVTPAEIAAVPLNDARLLAFVRKFVKETASAGAEFVRGELPARPLTAAAGDPTDDADEVLEAVVQSLKTRMVNRARAEIEREAIDALRTGGTAGEVIERAVMRQVESGAFRGDAGSVITKAFNVGREEAARILGGVDSVEVSALLDNNTCSVCEALDGRTAAFDSAEHDALLPPMRDCEGRDSCRCLLLFRRGGDE